MNLGTAQVIRGDARHLPLADNTVDLVVTSPPYFALRSYQDGGEHYAGQIGSEPTPTEFVAALLEVTRECVRVLKPSGSLWVNLGDKYAGSGPGGPQNGTRQAEKTLRKGRQGALPVTDVRQKSLIGIPWRYALACIDDLGLILRAEVIWSKPNGLPESVTDRVRRSHEVWFHFTLSPRYFSAVDEIREEHAESGLARRAYGFKVNDAQRVSLNPVINGAGERPANPLGKLPGSVWTIPTEPLTVPDHLGIDHFAAYPTEWPKRIIQGWSPAGVCVECGEGRRPVVAKERTCVQAVHNGRMWASPGAGELDPRPHFTTATITGYACACWPCGAVCNLDGCYGQRTDCAYAHREPPPTSSAVVLDPFGGTGTTALVAKALGRHGITIDMSNDYCRLAQWRTGDRNQLAKVLDLPRIPAVDDAQGLLFDQETGT